MYFYVMRMIQGFKFIFYILIICLFFYSCKEYETSSPEMVFKNVLEKSNSYDTTTSFRLDSILNFDWDRIMTRTPYTPINSFEKCGLLTNLPSSKLDGTEGLDEYFFTKNNKIIKYLVNKEKNPAMVLEFQKSLADQTCGIENSKNIFIKRIPNIDSLYKGKTFLIFSK